MTIRIAFVGAGNMAREHCKAFSDIPDVSIVGVFSRTRSRAEDLAAEFSIDHVYSSVDELWAGTNADIVIITVRELGTREVCRSAFRFPWLCLIEKPAGYDLHDAEFILDESKRSNARAFVLLNRRHYASTRSVLKALENSSEQRIVQIMDQENPQVALEHGEDPLVAKNWMYANSIHVIDYLKVFCRGDVTDVNHVIPWNSEHPYFVFVTLAFSSGDVGLYQAIWNGPGPWSVSISTRTRRFEMRPLEQATVQPHKSRKSEVLEGHEWDVKFKPGLRLQAEEALKALKCLDHQLPSLEEGFETMRLIKVIYAN